jgi:hypothetical protein
VVTIRIGKDLALKWLARIKDVAWLRSRVVSDLAFEPLRGDPQFIADVAKVVNQASAPDNGNPNRF